MPEGEVVAIAGRSGSGKTTLLTVIAGLEAPDAGTVTVLGPPRPTTPIPGTRSPCSPSRSASSRSSPSRRTSACRAVSSGSGSADDLADLLDRLGLSRLVRRFPSEISLGEQQRTALARAVLSQPLVLLADEPISHQNHEWAEVMMQIVADLATAGDTCLLATHNELAFAHAHRVLELHDGQLQPL